MTHPPLTAVGRCTSCMKDPRLLDPETRACKACLTRHCKVVEFFRRVRTEPEFKLYSTANLTPSKRKAFDAIFAGEDASVAGGKESSEFLIEEDDGDSSP